MTRPVTLPAASHWRDWDPARLAGEKQRRGIRVSLVLPARDEAATVGGIVARLRQELMAGTPLLDEIVVVDSDSSDSTAEVARAAGARVHPASSIRPDLGSRSGKGEAIWKSLFVTSGDVLVFMDADLTEWDTHFVTGLVGPLLAAEDVQLVKGFYDRPTTGPLAGGAGAVAVSEGGRVTELVARPLLTLHKPDLAGVVQPLGGEWALRRGLLERIALPTGYAVDLAVLVETYEAAGLGAIAQVDLGVRRHGHQPIRELGAMALQIMAMMEVRTRGRDLGDRLTLTQYDWSGAGVAAVARPVDLGDRPPALSVPGYLQSERDGGEPGAAAC